MLKLIIIVAVIWLALLPPLFTDGACTLEFDQASQQVMSDQKLFISSHAATTYWQQRAISSSLITEANCRPVKPRFLDRCTTGTVVYAEVPVKNRVCKIYRDDATSVLLYFDIKGRLDRIQTDMEPYKTLPIPFTNIKLHWGR